MNYHDVIYDRYITLAFGQMNSLDYDRSAKVYDLNYGDIIIPDKNIKILDIGCGMGHFIYYLKKYGYKNFLGVDIGKEQIEHCRSNITDKVELLDDTFLFLQSKTDCYDLIVLNDVLEHFKKDEIFTLLRLVFSSLKLGGRLIIKTPNMGNLFGLSSFYIDFTHEVGFSEISILQVLKATGFNKTECRPERLYISSRTKRALFSIVRVLYENILNFIVLVDRPGDNYPKIFSKNLIAWADK